MQACLVNLLVFLIEGNFVKWLPRVPQSVMPEGITAGMSLLPYFKAIASTFI